MPDARVPRLAFLTILLSTVTAATGWSQTTTWTGASNTTWGNALNWDNGVPNSSTNAVIANTANQPSGFIVDPDCLGLTIESGASVSLGSGFDLTVAGDLTIDGTLTVTSSSSDVTVDGSWTNNGTYTNGGAAVELTGTGDIDGSSTTVFDELVISGGTRTALSDFTVNGDVSIESSVSVALNGTTYLVGGNWTSSAPGISITGSGTVEFNGTGVLTTASNGIPNVLVSAGVRSVNDSTVTGDLSMTGGQLQILDNATLSVGGNASLTGGTLGFTSAFAGQEVLDIDGNAIVTSSAGSTSADTLIRVDGDWTSSSAFAPAGGTVQLGGASTTNVSGTGLSFVNIQVISGTKTFTDGAAISADLNIESGASIITQGVLDIDGKVVLGNASSSWALGNFTHTVAGNWTSTGGSATGAGTVEFDGPGGLVTSAGAIANVAVTGGARTINTTNVTGDLSMTGGSITVFDDATVTVGGNANFAVGTLTFDNVLAGLETLDIAGDMSLTATNGGTSANTLVQCEGAWASSGAFLFTDGTVELDGAGTRAVSGVGTNFHHLRVLSGTINVTDALALSGDLEVASGATLDTDAALDIDGKVLLGDATASWDLGASTHTVAGNWTSTGAEATGAGRIEFDASGGLATGGGSIANVTVSAGNRDTFSSRITGDLDVLSGSVTISDNRQLTVIGNAAFAVGTTLGFGDTTAGLETVDVNGNLTLLGASSGITANTLIRCAGDYASSGAFTWPAGTAELDGGTTATVSGAGTSFHDLNVVSGDKTFNDAVAVGGNIDVASGAALTTNAALAVTGNATLGDGTASWDIAAATHTIGGHLTSAGASATGAGTIELTGTGDLSTSTGSVSNVVVSGGAHSVQGASISGDLNVSAGSLTIEDNETLSVAGNATLGAGTTLTFADTTAGNEVLDVEGNVSLLATSSGVGANTIVRCGGDYTSSGAFNWPDGLAELDGGSSATVTGAGTNFHDLNVVSGTKTIDVAIPIGGDLDIASGAGLVTTAALAIAGNATLGDGTASWDVGTVTHTLVGNWTSTGASATGTGTVELTGTGDITSSTGAVPNVLVSSGDRTFDDTSVTGNLDVTGGTLTVADNATVNVTGNATLAAATTLTFDGTSAGDEVLDVAGNVDIASFNGGTPVTTMIRCAGNWTSTSDFAIDGGTVELTTASSTTVSGTGPIFNDLSVVSGAKQVISDIAVNGDLRVGVLATLDADAVLDVEGDVTMQATSFWDLGSDTHTVAGDLVTNGGSCPGTGFIEFDGTGQLSSGSGSIANVRNVSGFRLASDTTITGDLEMTGGGITIADNQTVAVNGNANLSAGELAFSDQTAGDEILDIDGNATITSTLGNISANSLIQCAGDWSSAIPFAPTAGTVQLDGGNDCHVLGRDAALFRSPDRERHQDLPDRRCGQRKPRGRQRRDARQRRSARRERQCLARRRHRRLGRRNGHPHGGGQLDLFGGRRRGRRHDRVRRPGHAASDDGNTVQRVDHERRAHLLRNDDHRRPDDDGRWNHVRERPGGRCRWQRRPDRRHDLVARQRAGRPGGPRRRR